jgi:hypothetical protein
MMGYDSRTKLMGNYKLPNDSERVYHEFKSPEMDVATQIAPLTRNG